MQNRTDQLFATKKKDILSVYFTAGYPKLNDTVTIIQSLQEAGVDLIEIGMPFSDPLADGSVIQASSTTALENGMSLKLLLEQLKDIRQKVQIPLILMGYFNPILQYGVERFCAEAKQIGIDGLILPDIPLDAYEKHYKATFEKHGLHNILLVSPRTSNERIRYIDQLSNGFIYAVSSSATTGAVVGEQTGQSAYFERLNSLGLRNPFLIGFGIGTHQQFTNACRYAPGAIIGTAFIKHLQQYPDLKNSIPSFIQSIRHDSTVAH